jgi:hypothetical protein
MAQRKAGGSRRSLKGVRLTDEQVIERVVELIRKTTVQVAENVERVVKLIVGRLRERERQEARRSKMGRKRWAKECSKTLNGLRRLLAKQNCPSELNIMKNERREISKNCDKSVNDEFFGRMLEDMQRDGQLLGQSVKENDRGIWKMIVCDPYVVPFEDLSRQPELLQEAADAYAEPTLIAAPELHAFMKKHAAATEPEWFYLTDLMRHLDLLQRVVDEWATARLTTPKHAYAKRHATAAALLLCNVYGIPKTTTKATKTGTGGAGVFAKLAALLYGYESADLQPYCREVLSRTHEEAKNGSSK